MISSTMLRFGHMLCVWATLAVVAQGQGLPSPQESVEAARQVVDWVRAGAVEGSARPFAGACVTIRLDGRVLGRGEVMGEGEDPLAEATRRALQRAASGLPADWDVRSEAARSRLCVCLELPGSLVPLEAKSDAELALGVSPGLDGVAVRMGTRIAARYPLQMLPARENVAMALRSLVAELADDPARGLAEFAELRQAGYTFYRFRTVQMAQLDPRSTPVFLHRGGRVVEMDEIDMARLREMADGLARHLLHRRWPGSEGYGFMGTLDPVTGKTERLFSNPVGQGLGISALCTYIRSPHADRSTVEQARRAVSELVRDLAKIEDGETEPWSDAASGAAVAAALLDAAPYLEGDNETLATLRERCVQRVVGSFDARSGDLAPGVDPDAWGLVSYAMVRLAQTRQGGVRLEQADAAVRAAYRHTPPARLVSHLPWLGWADIEVAGAGPVKGATLLLNTRRQIAEHQLDALSLAPDDRDLSGAVVFAKGSNPLPDWQSIRPLPLLADMLGDERLTGGTLHDGEAGTELGHVLGLLRYARQLCAESADGHMYARADRAAWGVRMSLWDPRMPIEASALTLEAVCRTLAAVETLAGRTDRPAEGAKGAQSP
ncbi:MAG: hypothetical protein KJZ65_14790 [Phycisphaerales bacterium]|nr:hypothetical protein [Phycisphaerales bacterium]